MYQAILKKDRTIRLSGADHYRLKLLSLNTGISVKRLISDAVPLLAKHYPSKNNDYAYEHHTQSRVEIEERLNDKS